MSHRGFEHTTPSVVRRSVRPALRVVVALVSTGVLVLAGYVWLTFRDLDAGLQRLPDIRVGAPDATTPDIDGTDQDILLVGNDDRSTMSDREVRELRVGRDGGSLATDTMMIVHVPADGSRATLISLPRDTKVQLPGYGEQNLNAPYSLGHESTHGDERAKRTAGANLLLGAVRRLTGLTIDRYVQVDLLGFYRISRTIGPVEVNMCAAVNDTVAHNRALGETDGGGSGLVLPKGRSKISGVQALAFVRQRHGLEGSDFDRVRRQQYFLTAAFRRVASVGILLQLPQLEDALTRSVFVDGKVELVQLARQMQHLTADNIVGRTIPETVDGHADPAQVKRFVRNVIDPPKRHPGAHPPAAPKHKALDAHCIK